MSILKRISKALQGKQEPIGTSAINPLTTAPSHPQQTRDAQTESASQEMREAITSAAEPWQEGQIIFNEFTVEGMLGEGGFGKVYLLTSRKTGERFAVKRAALVDPVSRRNFLSELESWINLPEYPHLVACRFIRTTSDEISIFSEYVDGGSLRDWIENRQMYEGSETVALERMLDVAIQFAWGLHAAHELGLVHQDVKPGNVMMTRAGQAKVSDFGLSQRKIEPREVEHVIDYIVQDLGEGEARHLAEAKLFEHFAEQDAGQTFEVPHKGGLSLAYASPEQATGSALTRRADIWSWGVSLLELFNGEIVWHTGTIAAEVLRELRQNGPSIEGVPVMPLQVSIILEKCFRQKSSERWASLGEASDALQNLYREIFNRNYPRTLPVLTRRKQKANTRRLPGGSRWQDPRIWLHQAYKAAGRNPITAMAFWPERIGSAKAQAISDLKALEHAKAIFEELAANERQDHKGDLGRLYADLALVHRSLDNFEGALGFYEQGIALLRQCRQPAERHNLLIALCGNAILLREMGREAESVNICNEIIGACQSLIEEGDDEYRRLLGFAYVTKANAMGDPHQKLELHRNAVRLFAQSNIMEDWAIALAGEAGALAHAGDYPAAHLAYEQAERRIKALIENERRLDLEHVLATLIFNWALLAKEKSDWRDALRLIDEAIRLFETLVNDRGQWRSTADLGRTYFSRGEILEGLGQPLQAIASYSQARVILSRAVLEEGRSELSDDLARAMQFESNLLRITGQQAAALDLAQKSVDFWSRLARHDPSDGTWQAKMAHAQSVLGPCLVEAGEVEAGLNCVNEAVNIFERLIDEHWREDYTHGLATAFLEMGAIRRKLGDAEAAVRAYALALKNLETLKSPGAQITHSLVCANLSNVLSDLGHQEDALYYINKAITLSEDLVEVRGITKHLAELISFYQNKANKLTRIGRSREALPLYQRSTRIFRELIEKEGRDDLRFEMFRLLAAQGMTEEKLLDLKSALASFAYANEMIQDLPNQPQNQEFTAMANYVQKKIHDINALLNINPSDYDELANKAENLIAKGKQIGRDGAVDFSCRLYDEAIVIYTQLGLAERRPHWDAGLANAYMHKALATKYIEQMDISEESFRAALKIYDRLVTERQDEMYLTEWAKSCLGLANLLPLINQKQEAKEIIYQMQRRLRGTRNNNYGKWLELADEVLQTHQL